ncbi:hypothetical protein TA3x_001108 [Tundrisphaera sp. TA3]|uniref:hypothetical protein n=1 Tax=Tundrisphaera sp. TA3 TaxID=3435775 RepID=UPI003EBDD37D
MYKPFNKKTQSDFRKKHRKSIDPQQVVACPTCGSDKVRPAKVSVYAGQCHTHITHEGTLCEGSDSVGWGTMINLLFACELDHQFVLSYQYYDQETEFEVVSMMDPNPAPPIYWKPEDKKVMQSRGKK